MKPEGSLPRSQEPATGPYPQPDESSSYHTLILHLHLHLFLFRRSNQFPVGMNIKHVTYYKFVMTTHHLSIDLLDGIIRPLTNRSSCQYLF
jgi:hypothetical protein